MSILDIRLLHHNQSYPLPPWIKFAFGLGAFLRQEGIQNSNYANVAISLPTDQYFAVFVACGIADNAFSENMQLGLIRKQIIGLNSGSRVIFKHAGQTKEVSVISVEKNPYTDEMLLYIQDGSVKHGVPERSWMESIFLLDEEFNEIKRSRRVNKKLGITSPFLNSLYTQNQLSKTPFFPGNEFYIIGSRNTTQDVLNDKCFIQGDVIGSPTDFLYVEGLDNNSSYTNGKFYSNQIKRFSDEINSKVPVLYSDIGSFRRLYWYFVKNPSLIVLSRTDHENRIYEVQAELSRRLIQGNAQFITEEIVTYLKGSDIRVPNGIEMIAWREK